MLDGARQDAPGKLFLVRSLLWGFSDLKHSHNSVFMSTDCIVWYENYARSGLDSPQSLWQADRRERQNSQKTTGASGVCVTCWTSRIQLPSSCQQSQTQTLHSLSILRLQRWPTPAGQAGGPTSWSSCRMWWSNPCGSTNSPGPSISLLMQ